MYSKSAAEPTSPAAEPQLDEILAFFKETRERVRGQWIEKMKAQGFLTDATEHEISVEYETLCDAFLECLETGQYEQAESRAAQIVHGVPDYEHALQDFFAGILTLRDVFIRPLIQRYQTERLQKVVDVYVPVISRVISAFALTAIEEREKASREQQEAISKLSTPVLQLREGLLLLPIIDLSPTRSVLPMGTTNRCW